MSSLKVQSPNGLLKPTGRRPFRIELKFSLEQWEWLCELGRLEKTSVYNVLKHRIFNGTHFEDHSHHDTLTHTQPSDLEEK